MMLDSDASYRALVARDRRFDGAFFVGVSTTGIYCRPICTAKTPGRGRCTFFRRAAEAEKAGYRACFRCRPELAPGNPSPVDARRGLAARAVMRIEEGALNERSQGDLAVELGVTPRHLRRAVQKELGVSPIELAQTFRLALAKQLLQDTSLPVTEVAFASGFASLRRFNALFAERFGRKPTEVRRQSGVETTDALTLSLGYRAPLAFSALLGFFADRATRKVELVGGAVYARTLRIGARTGWIRIHDREDLGVLRLKLSPSLAKDAMTVAAATRRAFDLDADPTPVAAHLRKDAILRRCLSRTPRIPGAFDPFEIAVRAVLGQQISVKGATTLAGRFAETFGERIATPIEGLERLAPTAARVATATANEVRAIGVPKARAESILALARAFESGALGRLAPHADLDETRAKLVAIPGIGPWTASYVALRILGDPDAFLETDLGLQRACGGISARALLQRAEAWRPWRAYAALALWTQGSGG